MKIYLHNQMLVPIRKHKIKTNIHNWSGLESTDQNSEKPMFGNATPMHANIQNFFRIVTINVRNELWKSQIDIAKVGYFTGQ